MANKAKPVQAGDPITFRLPVNTPTEVLDYLTALKSAGEFGKECSRIFINAIQSKLDPSPRVSLLLPESLPTEKQQWLDNKESQRIIGKWLYQLLTQKSAVPFEIPVEEAKGPIKMPAPVQNLFNGIMAGMDDE